jgi:hypothetical protein
MAAQRGARHQARRAVTVELQIDVEDSAPHLRRDSAHGDADFVSTNVDAPD